MAERRDPEQDRPADRPADPAADPAADRSADPAGTRHAETGRSHGEDHHDTRPLDTEQSGDDRHGRGGEAWSERGHEQHRSDEQGRSYEQDRAYEQGRSPDRHRDEEAEQARRERFGGANVGAAFFGWLVAVGMALLLASILGAVAAGIGRSLELTQSDAEAEADSIGLAAGIALLVVLLVAYYLGGYVAGRMSRYDGGRQGLAVWVLGLVLTIVAAVIGLVFGNQYDVMNRVDLPSIPIPTDTLTVSGIVTLAAVVVGTLLAAMVGGKAGHRYHRKVDRYVG